MIDLLEKAGYVVLSWTTLSLVLAVVWSKFMSRMHRKERHLVIPARRRTAPRLHVVRGSLARARLGGYAS